MANTDVSQYNPDALSHVFELHAVTRAFGAARAVDDLSLQFHQGQTSVLIGSSGSGKSTVLRLLIGLEWPTSGTVLHQGQAVTRDNILSIRRQVGYVIQEGGLFPHLTVTGNLALLPRYLGWSKAAIDARIGELVELTHLYPELLPRFPAELSGGQRQRVALMRALMLDPPTLLLDEPLGALDPLVRYYLQEELKQIFSKLDKTVILVTHDMAEAAFFSDRLILMRAGKILQQGTIADFQHRPADAFVKEFLAAHRAVPGDTA